MRKRWLMLPLVLVLAGCSDTNRESYSITEPPPNPTLDVNGIWQGVLQMPGETVSFSLTASHEACSEYVEGSFVLRGRRFQMSGETKCVTYGRGSLDFWAVSVEPGCSYGGHLEVSDGDDAEGAFTFDASCDGGAVDQGYLNLHRVDLTHDKID